MTTQKDLSALRTVADLPIVSHAGMEYFKFLISCEEAELSEDQVIERQILTLLLSNMAPPQ